MAILPQQLPFCGPPSADRTCAPGRSAMTMQRVSAPWWRGGAPVGPGRTGPEMAAWRLWAVLAALRAGWCLLPQAGYLHPDEFFQSPEVMAGKATRGGRAATRGGRAAAPGEGGGGAGGGAAAGREGAPPPPLVGGGGPGRGPGPGDTKAAGEAGSCRPCFGCPLLRRPCRQRGARRPPLVFWFLWQLLPSKYWPEPCCPKRCGSVSETWLKLMV